MVMRGAKRKGVRYFGPYAHAYAIRETLDLLLRTFPIRTCTKGKFDRHHRLGRPCLYAHIEKCVGAVRRRRSTHERLHGARQRAHRLPRRRHRRRCSTASRRQMHEAADALEFERAARLRDQLASVRKAIERQQMVAPSEEDYDVIGIAEDALEASVQVFYVRKGPGRRAARAWSSTRSRTSSRPALVGAPRSSSSTPTRGPDDVPREILVPTSPRTRRSTRSCSRCSAARRVRDPRPAARARSASCSATVTANAQEAFARHKLRRASDHNARARALVALQEALALPEAPLRIECFDISNLQGTEIVALDGRDGGRPAEALRLPTVQGAPPRRPGRLRGDGGGADPPVPSLPQRARRGRAPGKRFAYPPNLLLIDGGKGQLGVAVRVLEELGLEEICGRQPRQALRGGVRPGRAEPVRIPRDSEALYLLQQVRDEAHRFAITYHRQLREQDA